MVHLCMYATRLSITKTVVERFKERGAIFVDNLADVPEGAVTLFSAHGVSKAIYDEAGARKLVAIDATCPLVTKVHHEAKRYADQGYHIVMVGHRGHVEVEGTTGHIPNGAFTIVDNLAEAETVQLPETDLAVVTQTTLSVDETKEILDILQARFPAIKLPPKKDICYATQNRQDAVKEIAPLVEIFLVVGSTTSSNSKRLQETALAYGAKEAYLIDCAAELPPHAKNAASIGLSSGASAPEDLVQDIISTLNPQEVKEVTVREENMTFQLPVQVR